MICDRCKKYTANPKHRLEAIARLEPRSPEMQSHATDVRCFDHLVVKLQGWAAYITVTPLPDHEDEVAEAQRKAAEWAVPVPA